MIGILAPLAVLGAITLVVVLFLQRGREGIDLSPRGLLRLYLYLASLAAVVVLAFGLASTVNYGLARVIGDEFIYGGPGPAGPPIPRCPPDAIAKGCFEPTPEQLEQQRIAQKAQTERRRDEDLIRGITFTVFGGLFWGAHWGARRGLGETEAAMSGLRRGYLMLGTVVFGVATIVLLPTGIYQSISNVLLTTPQSFYRQGSDSLGAGIVSLPIWLIYLRLVVTEFRQTA